MIYDFKKFNKSFKIKGIDISEYAIENSIEEIKNQLIVGSAEKLPFNDNSFDLVISINTIHNLDLNKCLQSIKEIQRVSNGKAFIQVDAYNNDEELQAFKDWMLTAKTFMKPKEWLEVFKESGYKGYYFWTILELE